MSIRLQKVDLTSKGWDVTTRSIQLTEDGNEPNEQILETPLEKLTTSDLQGTGVFDVLMRATKLHLQEEYDNQRITGHEYATVYLGALSAVLQASAAFLVNEVQVQEMNARIGLIRQQTVTELANTDDNIPVGLGFNRIPNVTTPIPAVMSGSL